MLLRTSTTIFVVLFIFILTSFAQAHPPKVSKPFEYSGYTEPQFEDFAVTSEYVEMSDGTQIAIDLYLPTKGPDQTSFPTIFLYGPYKRSTIDLESGRIQHYEGVDKFFTSYGYAIVFADMRGTGISTGWMMDFFPKIWEDGEELVDWIEKQPWCDGNVGMGDGSYLGWSQTATACQMPKALKCIMPAYIPFDAYTSIVYPGGIFLQGYINRWSAVQYDVRRNHYGGEEGPFPTKPVIDEDGDGELSDEIPLDLDGDGSFLDEDFPPSYSDGEARKHIYYHATREHEEGYDVAEWTAERHFIDSESPLGYTLHELGPNAHVPGLMETGIPIYHVGGWFDYYTRDSLQLYCTLKRSNPSKIFMGPTYHGTYGPFYEYLNVDSKKATQKYFVEILRFFDRFLKEIENGIDKEPPIYIYVFNGEGYRFEDEWPLAREVREQLYLEDDHQLVVMRTENGTDTYPADYSHRSTYGTNDGSRWHPAPNALPIRTEKDRKCLVYDSRPMEADLEVTGHPILDFWVSSTADYGDFFVYLADVDEGGEAILVTEGQLRAGFAGLVDNDEMIFSSDRGIEVLPELPWHGYEEAQYIDRIFANANVVNLVIDFQPTSWVFRKGHKIRVSIASSNFPTFRLHPQLCPTNDPKDPNNTIPTVTVYRDEEHPSHLNLPTIPSKR